MFINFLAITIQLPHVYYNGISSYLLNDITSKYYEYAMIIKCVSYILSSLPYIHYNLECFYVMRIVYNIANDKQVHFTSILYID